MKKLFLLLALVVSWNAYAQKSAKEKKGDKYFDYYSFFSAIEQYNATENLTIEGQRKLAESYRNVGNYKECEKILAGFINSSEVNAEDIFHYASILRANGKYEESNLWMKKLQATAPEDLRAKSFTANMDKLHELMKDGGRYKITNLDVNTDHQEFGTAFYLQQIVYASTKEDIKPVKHVYNWNQRPFLDLYVAGLSDGQMVNARQLSKKLNNKMHEGPASFTEDGKFMAFTCNNYKSKSTDNIIKLQIFFAEKNSRGDWGNLTPFKLNNAEYSVAFPCLSKDGKTMYFASDMPGGFGGVDIYRIERKEDGTWGEAVNLGSAVNTEANEMFPFFHEEQKVLFFASNGHHGLGGLDIFAAPADQSMQFNKVLNPGHPLNTRYDDFALIMDASMSRGYFSSNREGGKGDDDIYMLDMLRPFNFGKVIKGIAKDTKGNVLAGVKVTLYDESGNVTATGTTSSNGEYEFIAEPDKDLRVEAALDNYKGMSTKISTKTDKDEVKTDLVLEKNSSLMLIITDAATKETLKGVKINIEDKLSGKKFENDPSSDIFVLPVPEKKTGDKLSYTIRLEKEGYLSKTVNFNSRIDEPGEILIHEKIDISVSKLEVGGDLAKMIDLKPIYFDLGKSNIRKDAAEELDKIVKILNEYPAMVVEIGSHTDCRSSFDFNMKLSDARAKSSMEYIRKRIPNPSRVSGKGYGESKLKNNCACEGAVKSDCIEEQHQENRRTEFIIIRFR